MANSESDDYEDFSNYSFETPEILPDGFWSTEALRANSAPIFQDRFQLKLAPVPGDGECLIHSITRSLGLITPQRWLGSSVWDWARLFRFHLARHISGEEDLAFLSSNSYLDDRFAILFARLWRLRLIIHPVQEWPQRELDFDSALYFPLPPDDDLLSIHLVCFTNRRHYDLLVPTQRNFFSHCCTITARDLRKYFTANEEGEARFDRFIFKWLDVLRSPNPSASDGLYKFSSISNFLRVFPESSWPTLPYLDEPITSDGSIFVPNGEDLLQSIHVAPGRIEDGSSSVSTVGSFNDAAPTNSRKLIDRYKLFCCLSVPCIVHVYRYVWV